MPAWESGNLDELRRRARINLNRLLPFVERGAKVISESPCVGPAHIASTIPVAKSNRREVTQVACRETTHAELISDLRA